MNEVQFDSPLGDEALLFRRMHCREELGRLTEIRLELLRPNASPAVKPAELLGKPASVTIQAEPKVRFLHGLVSEFERGGEVSGGFDVYRLVLRPWLWQLTLGADCRIFQDKTVVQILDAVFAEYGSTSSVDKTSLRSYDKRPFTVQYRESDFDFVSRLMQEEGIYYYFRHERNRHLMVLCDGPSAHKPMPGASVVWSAVQTRGEHMREDIITHWTRTHALQSLKYTSTDFAAEAPTASLQVTAQRSTPYPELGDLEVFDYPGGHDDLTMVGGAGPKKNKGETAAALLVAGYETRHDVATALTQHRPLAVGSTFTLKDHPTDNGDFLVTSSITEVEYTGYEGADDAIGTNYACRFDAVPKDAPFQPERIVPWPVVHGPQTATVVGPAGDEIHVDKFGRVKVQFHWDRVGQKDAKSSCWVRVSQPWAGKGFGFMAVPRIGDEVVVTFLEGNPDRPMITGRVYNADNMPPWALPAQATVSGVKTRSSKGGKAENANELRFDDATGKEYVWFHAEKDYHQWVKNDAQVTVEANRVQEIKKDDAVKIGGKLDGEVAKAVTLKVGEDVHTTVGGDFALKITGATGLSITGATKLKSVGNTAISTDDALEVDAATGMKFSTMSNVHIKATTGIVIDGGLQLAIKAGAAFITLGPDGVSISGPMVKINSGGSAGAASKAAKANPPRPKQPPAPKEHKDPLAK